MIRENYEKKIGASLIIRMCGESDVDIKILSSLKQHEIYAQGIRHVALSMEKVTNIYSAIINKMVEIYKSLIEIKISMSLVAVPDRVRAVLSGVKLDNHMKIYRSEYDFILANNLHEASGREECGIAREMMDFSIHREDKEEGRVAVFYVCGALIEPHHASQFVDQIDLAVNGKITRCVVDLKKATYIDSVNAGAFVRAHKLCAQQNVPFSVHNANDLIDEVFRLTGIDTLFHVEKELP